MRRIPFEPLDPAHYRELVRRALAEDLGWGDVTTEGTVDADRKARGVLVAKSPCVVAGLDVVRKIQQQPVQGQNLTPPVPITRASRIR